MRAPKPLRRPAPRRADGISSAREWPGPIPAARIAAPIPQALAHAEWRNGHAAVRAGSAASVDSIRSSPPFALTASFPARARPGILADGLRLSTIELGNSIVAPLSRVVS